MEATLINPALTEINRQTQFANIKLRLIAFLIDNTIFCFVAGILLYFFYGEETQLVQENDPTGLLHNIEAGAHFMLARPELIALFLVLHWLYYAVSESSVRQATPGKYALKIKVTCLGGFRVSFWRASLRYIGKIISLAPASIGIWTSFFSHRKQMLHDKISSCQLVRR